MLLKDHMSASGAHLFRWRSYLPMVFIPLIALTLRHGEVVEMRLGDGFGDLYEAFFAFMIIAGEGVRIATVGFVANGTSGRNTTGQIADNLNVTGLYSLVRNPLYLGNCMMYLGVAGSSDNLMLTLVLGLVLALYYERIISAEETFLEQKFGQSYRSWAATTPTFFPRLTGWVRADRAFSVKMVIRREHPSIYGAIVALYLTALGQHSYGAHREPFAPGWHWVMALATLAILAVLVIKRRTNLLAVAS